MKINKYKKMIIIIVSLIVIIIIALLILMFNKNNSNEYSDIQNSMEHIFYYLDEDNYADMNSISDFCKLSLVYDSDYLSSDEKIYDDKEKVIQAYTKEQVTSSIQSILGKDSNINFQSNEDGSYNFLTPDSCRLGNVNASNLSYDSDKEIIYSNGNLDSNYYLQVKWSTPHTVGNKITMSAQALMIVKNDNDYSLFVDSSMKELLGTYKSLKEAKKEALKKMDYSYDYEFTLEKEDNNIIWKTFTRTKMNPDTIID